MNIYKKTKLIKLRVPATPLRGFGAMLAEIKAVLSLRLPCLVAIPYLVHVIDLRLLSLPSVPEKLRPHRAAFDACEDTKPSIRANLRLACLAFLALFASLSFAPTTGWQLELSRFMLVRWLLSYFSLSTNPLRHAIAHMPWDVRIDPILQLAELACGYVPNFFRYAHISAHHTDGPDFIRISPGSTYSMEARLQLLADGLVAMCTGRRVLQRLTPLNQLYLALSFASFYAGAFLLACVRPSVFVAVLLSTISQWAHVCIGTATQHLFVTHDDDVYASFPLCLHSRNPFWTCQRSGIPSNHIMHHAPANAAFNADDFHELWAGRRSNWQAELPTLHRSGTLAFAGLDINQERLIPNAKFTQCNAQGTEPLPFSVAGGMACRHGAAAAARPSHCPSRTRAAGWLEN